MRSSILLCFLLLGMGALPGRLSSQSAATGAEIQGAEIQGAVRDASGAPLGGITLRLKPLSGNAAVAETLSEPGGTFRFAGVEAGSYSLEAQGRGFLPVVREVIAPVGAPLALRMQQITTTVEVSAPVDDFLTSTSVSVTKSPVDLMNSPYAVQVIPKALIEERGIQDIKQLFRNIAGAGDAPYTAMTMRGFTQREILFNGVRGNPYGSLENDLNDAGFSTSQGRLSNVEFVEVLKGPAAVLFGNGEPGGVVNFVTRKPRNRTTAEASFRMGSFRQRGGHGELTGPMAKTVFYRLAWYQEDRNTFRYNSRNENSHFAGGLSWKPGEATSVGIEYEYISQFLPAHRLRGVPVNGAGDFLTNREWTSTEPSDSSALQARVLQVRLDHALTSTLRTDVTFRYLNSDRPERYHEPRGIRAGEWMRREFRDQFRGNDDWSVVANGYEQLTTDHFGTHQLVFGVELARQDWAARYGRARDSGVGGPVPDLNLFRPVYGQTRGELYVIPESAFLRQSIDSRKQGFFAQDQIQLSPRLSLLFGGRVERVSDEGLAPEPLLFETTAVTGRAGAVYRMASWLSAYGSLSNSFVRAPVLSQSASANGPHDPETGRQWEGGLKAELPGGRFFLTSSIYQIVKNNVLRPDPNFGPTGANFAAVLPVGEARSQGVEVDFTARILRGLQTIVNYAYIDSEIRADATAPALVGQPLPNVPKHSFGLFANYEIPRTGTTLHVGSEARSRRVEPYAAIAAAGYGIWDFGVFQRVSRGVDVRAQLTNAFDRLYATSSLFAARAGNFPGEPRTLTVSLHYNWTRD